MDLPSDPVNEVSKHQEQNAKQNYNGRFVTNYSHCRSSSAAHIDTDKGQKNDKGLSYNVIPSFPAM